MLKLWRWLTKPLDLRLVWIIIFHCSAWMQLLIHANYVSKTNPDAESMDFCSEQGKSEGFHSCDRPSNLTQIGLKSSTFQPVWPWNLMDDLENYRAPLLHDIKLCTLSETPEWIQTGITVRKRSIIDIPLSNMTLLHTKIRNKLDSLLGIKIPYLLLFVLLRVPWGCGGD